MRNQIAIVGKRTGFSSLSDSMSLSVLFDKPVKMDEGLHHEFVWTVTGAGSQKNMYRIEAGSMHESTNSLLSVNLIRKSRDVSGEIMLSVVIEFYEMSQHDYLRQLHEDEEMAERGAKIFLRGNPQPTKSLEDLAREVDELFNQTKWKGKQ